MYLISTQFLMKEYAFSRHAISFLVLLFFLAVLDLRCFAQAFSSCAKWRLLLLPRVDFSLRWLLLLGSRFSSCVGFSSCGTQALEHRLSGCGLAVAMGLVALQHVESWIRDPGSGIRPMALALSGGLLMHCTTRELLASVSKLCVPTSMETLYRYSYVIRLIFLLSFL